MNNKTFYLNDVGIINALGSGKQEIYSHLKKGNAPGMGEMISPIYSKPFYAGQVLQPLPRIPERLKNFACRNNQLALAAIEQISESIEVAKSRYGSSRIAIVMGTSTSGIAEAELAMREMQENGQLPSSFDYKQQEIGAVAEFLASYLNVTGPAYTVSTACSSSGKVFGSARELLALDLCDFVILGGVDSLCELTLSGFASLEATSSVLTNPFSINRQGINIGEGAAIFTMSRENSTIALFGVGESSDAHHMSAPEPNGEGAQSAMSTALLDAGLVAKDIDYINLHGTGTQLNDAMESHAIFSIFKNEVPCSSTKPLTGHTLGAAGATELAICWLLLHNASERKLAIHQYDGQVDPELSDIQLVKNAEIETPIKTTMSNSFAFGGNNVSVVLGIC